MSSSFTESYYPSRAGVKASINCRSSHYLLDAAQNAGLVVVPGASQQSVKAPASAADVAKALGVLCYDVAAVPDTTYDFQASAVAEVVHEGVMWVTCEEAMTYGSAVYCRHTANGAGKLVLGAVRSDADTANAALLGNCRVEVASSGAGVVGLRVNLPHAPNA